MISEQQVLVQLESIESNSVAPPFVIVFLTAISSDLAESVLSRDSVSGVVLARRPESQMLADDPRVGFCQRLGDGVWPLPQGTVPTIVVFGTDANVGIRMIRKAFHRRVHQFVFIEPPLGVVRYYGIYGLATRYASRRVGHLIGAMTRFAYRKTEQLLPKSTVLPWLKGTVLPWLKRVASAAARRGKFLLLPHHIRHILRRVSRAEADVGPGGGCAILTIGTLGPGGSERQVVNTALALSADGQFRPIVACLDLSNDTSAFYRTPLERAGIEVVDLSALVPTVARSKDLKRLQARLRNLGQLPDDLKTDISQFLMFFLREKPMIVHAFLDDTNVKAGIAAVLANVPRIILSARSVAPDNFALHRGYMRPAYKALLDQPDVILCNNSHAGATDYRRWLGNQTPRIEVVHNGIDFAEFGVRSKVDRKLRTVWGVPDNALVLGSIMRLSEEKQPALWARVAVEISRRLPDVHFILGGDGPLRVEVERIVAQARIQNRVHILGQIQDPAAVLRALDIFLLTSRLEGLPNVLIEAQAVGVPVVTTPAGGASEALDPGRTGLVSRDQTIRSIADACTALLTDSELRMQFAEAAPNFVRERFASEAMVADTLRLYKS